MENLEEFIDRIIEEKGLDKEAPEVVAQIRQDLSESLERRINAMIVSKLDPAILSDFDALLDGGDMQKVQSFVKTHIPDIEERVAAELLEFKTLYLA